MSVIHFVGTIGECSTAASCGTLVVVDSPVGHAVLVAVAASHGFEAGDGASIDVGAGGHHGLCLVSWRLNLVLVVQLIGIEWMDTGSVWNAY